MRGTFRLLLEFWETILLGIIVIIVIILDHIINKKTPLTPSDYIAEMTILVLVITLYFTFSYRGRIIFTRPTHFAITRRNRLVRPTPDSDPDKVKNWVEDDEFIIPVSIVNKGAYSRSLYFALELNYTHIEDNTKRSELYTFDFYIENLPHSPLVKKSGILELDKTTNVFFSKPVNVKGRDAVVIECIFANKDDIFEISNQLNELEVSMNFFYRSGNPINFLKHKGWKPAFSIIKKFPEDLSDALNRTHFWSITAFKFNSDWSIRNNIPPDGLLEEDESS